VAEQVLDHGGALAAFDELHRGGVAERVGGCALGIGTPARLNHRRTQWSKAAVVSGSSRVLSKSGSFLRAGLPVRSSREVR
jgi:hypothetical protein